MASLPSRPHWAKSDIARAPGVREDQRPAPAAGLARLEWASGNNYGKNAGEKAERKKSVSDQDMCWLIILNEKP